MIITMTCAQLG